MTTIQKYLLLLLAFCFSATALAQDKPPLIVEIERAFQQEEPAWRVERVGVQNASDPFVQDMVFRSGRVQAAVSGEELRTRIPHSMDSLSHSATPAAQG